MRAAEGSRSGMRSAAAGCGLHRGRRELRSQQAGDAGGPTLRDVSGREYAEDDQWGAMRAAGAVGERDAGTLQVGAICTGCRLAAALLRCCVAAGCGPRRDESGRSGWWMETGREVSRCVRARTSCPARYFQALPPLQLPLSLSLSSCFSPRALSLALDSGSFFAYRGQSGPGDLKSRSGWTVGPTNAGLVVRTLEQNVRGDHPQPSQGVLGSRQGCPTFSQTVVWVRFPGRRGGR